jgi:hypothetical protein
MVIESLHSGKTLSCSHEMQKHRNNNFTTTERDIQALCMHEIVQEKEKRQKFSDKLKRHF